MLEDTFRTIERQEEDGWVVVARDSDWETRLGKKISTFFACKYFLFYRVAQNKCHPWRERGDSSLGDTLGRGGWYLQVSCSKCQL